MTSTCIEYQCTNSVTGSAVVETEYSLAMRDLPAMLGPHIGFDISIGLSALNPLLRTYLEACLPQSKRRLLRLCPEHRTREEGGPELRRIYFTHSATNSR